MINENLYTEVLDSLGRKPRKSSASVKPSSLTCVRRMTFELLAFPKKESVSPEDRLLMDTGTAIHRMIQDHLKDAVPIVRPGWEFHSEVRVNAKTCRKAAELLVSSSLDGVFEGTPTGRRVLEIKTIGDSAMSALKSPKAEHVEQLNTYLYLVDAPFGDLMYVNRANTSFFKFYERPFNEKLWQATLEKIRMAMQGASEHRLPPTPATDYTCKICPYQYTCRKKGEWIDAARPDGG